MKERYICKTRLNLVFNFRFPADRFDRRLKLVIQNTLTAISPTTHSPFASIPWNCMYKFSCWQLKAAEKETVQHFKPHPGKACTFLFWQLRPLLLLLSLLLSLMRKYLCKRVFSWDFIQPIPLLLFHWASRSPSPLFAIWYSGEENEVKQTNILACEFTLFLTWQIQRQYTTALLPKPRFVTMLKFKKQAERSWPGEDPFSILNINVE